MTLNLFTGVVYYYTNKLNNKIYIGKTINEEDRKRRHKSQVKLNKGNVYFYNAIKKYGWENFIYSILYRIQSANKKEVNKKLLQIEIFMISLFKTNKIGYNMTRGGEGAGDRIVTEKEKIERKKKYIKENHPMFGKPGAMAKQVLKLSKEGELIREYSSIKEAAVKNKAAVANISSCCHLRRFSVGGYVYRFKEMYNNSVDLFTSFREGKEYKYKKEDKKRIYMEIKNNEKVCTKCKKTLTLDDFRRNPRNKEIYLSECKKCQLEYQRNYNNKKQVSAIPR